MDAHVGRVLGQSKQIVLEPEFLSLRNWVFLEAVGMQTWPLPAAVMFPSAWMLPDMVSCLFIMLLQRQARSMQSASVGFDAMKMTANKRKSNKTERS